MLRRITPLLAGFVLGVTAQLLQSALWEWSWYAALCLAGVAGLAALQGRSGPDGKRGVLLACAAALLLGFGQTGWRAAAFQSGRLDAGLEGRDLLLTGVVAAMPQSNEAGVRFRFDVEQALVEGRLVTVPARVVLGWYNGNLGWSGNGGAPELLRQPADIRAGERWQFQARLKAPHGNVNPHGFDYELWLWEQGLQATGSVRAGPRDLAPQRLATTWHHPVESLRQTVRQRIYERVDERRWAGLIAALVVGDQNAIDRNDWDVFRATGVAHLMSISGLHVTMFAWLAVGVIGWAWRQSAALCLRWPAQHAAIVGGMLLAAAYAVFSGWGVPSQRTVCMLATVGMLRLSGRRWPWPVVWTLACAVVVAADPWALTQAGFWLSFVAVAVLFASGSGNPAQTGAGATARGMLREQWVVTVALTPLTLILFGQASLVGMLANALAIPWVTLLVTPLAMGGAVVAPLWDVAAWSIRLLSVFLEWLTAWPWVTLSLPQAPLWAGLCAIAGATLLVLRLPWTVRSAGVPLLVPLLFWPVPRPEPGQFELLAADVGQGNAVLVRTRHHALLYDAGPRFSRETDAGHRVLVPLLRALDVRLDMLMLSHRDSDHSGGAAAVLGMQRQAVLSSSIEDDHELQQLRPSMRCMAGQRWTWDGVDFEVLHPQGADYQNRSRPNAMSCVLRVASQAVPGSAPRVALLAGDIERPQEHRLLALGAPVRADMLLVPHHGSRTSSSSEFLQAVAPRYALVQTGYRNRFGHPAAEVLARYRERDIIVVNSPHCGALSWRSDSPDLVRCERDERRRYWHHPAP